MYILLQEVQPPVYIYPGDSRSRVYAQSVSAHFVSAQSKIFANILNLIIFYEQRVETGPNRLLSIRLCVTIRYCIKTAKRMVDF